MSKFKVGDWIRLTDSYGCVYKVTENQYHYTVYEYNFKIRYKKFSYSRAFLDKNRNHAFRKVNKNPITLELYKDRIHEEHEDYLLIIPE